MNDYSQLSRVELEQRLALAEDVCLMHGWTGSASGGVRQDAATECWMRWARLVGPDFTNPENQPELIGAEGSLAAQRRATREATLRRLRGDG